MSPWKNDPRFSPYPAAPCKTPSGTSPNARSLSAASQHPMAKPSPGETPQHLQGFPHLFILSSFTLRLPQRVPRAPRSCSDAICQGSRNIWQLVHPASPLLTPRAFCPTGSAPVPAEAPSWKGLNPETRGKSPLLPHLLSVSQPLGVQQHQRVSGLAGVRHAPHPDSFGVRPHAGAQGETWGCKEPEQREIPSRRSRAPRPGQGMCTSHPLPLPLLCPASQFRR